MVDKSKDNPIFNAMDPLIYPFSNLEKDESKKVSFKINGHTVQISKKLILKMTSIGTAVLSLGTAQLSYYLTKKGISKLIEKQKEVRKEQSLSSQTESKNEVVVSPEEEVDETKSEANASYLASLGKKVVTGELPELKDLKSNFFVQPFDMTQKFFIKEEKDHCVCRIFFPNRRFEDIEIDKHYDLKSTVEGIVELKIEQQEQRESQINEIRKQLAPGYRLYAGKKDIQIGNDGPVYRISYQENIVEKFNEIAKYYPQIRKSQTSAPEVLKPPIKENIAKPTQENTEKPSIPENIKMKGMELFYVSSEKLKARLLRLGDQGEGVFAVNGKNYELYMKFPWGIEKTQVASDDKRGIQQFIKQNKLKLKELNELNPSVINNPAYLFLEDLKPNRILLLKEGDNFICYQKVFGNKVLEFEVRANDIGQLRNKVNENKRISSEKQRQFEELKLKQNEWNFIVRETDEEIKQALDNNLLGKQALVYFSKSQPGNLSVIINDGNGLIKKTIPYEENLNDGAIRIINEIVQRKPSKPAMPNEIADFVGKGGKYFEDRQQARYYLGHHPKESVIYQEHGKYYVAHHLGDADFVQFTPLIRLNSLAKQVTEIRENNIRKLKEREAEFQKLGDEESNDKGIYTARSPRDVEALLRSFNQIGTIVMYSTKSGDVRFFQILPNGEIDKKTIPFDLNTSLTETVRKISAENMKRPSKRSTQFKQVESKYKVQNREEAINTIGEKRGFRIWLINPENPHGPCGLYYNDGKGKITEIEIDAKQDLINEIRKYHHVGDLQTVAMKLQTDDLVALKNQFLSLCNEHLDRNSQDISFSDLPGIYVKLARLYHPDRLSGDPDREQKAQKFTQIGLIYNELADKVLTRVTEKDTMKERFAVIDFEVQKGRRI